MSKAGMSKERGFGGANLGCLRGNLLVQLSGEDQVLGEKILELEVIVRVLTGPRGSGECKSQLCSEAEFRACGAVHVGSEPGPGPPVSWLR